MKKPAKLEWWISFDRFVFVVLARSFGHTVRLAYRKHCKTCAALKVKPFRLETSEDGGWYGVHGGLKSKLFEAAA